MSDPYELNAFFIRHAIERPLGSPLPTSYINLPSSSSQNLDYLSPTRNAYINCLPERPSQRFSNPSTHSSRKTFSERAEEIIPRARMAFKFGRSSTSTSSSSSSTVYIVNVVIRFIQFIFAIAVIGLYGTDISNARKGHEHQDSRWIYAEVVAALSALTCLVFMIPGLKLYIAFGWDLVLFILWTAVFGVFAHIYVHQNPHGDHNISRLKNAVWIDLINMLLWFVTAVTGAIAFWRHRNSRSTYTGRATV